MYKNAYGGLFIAVDGPSGVGKTSLIQHIQCELDKCGIKVYCTREPTDTNYGDFVRTSAEILDKESLTCLVASDRYFHLENDIIPRLKNGEIVITDRYILSSLVFQCMDGVTTDFILSVNEKIIQPDVQIVVTADAEIIQNRLSTRGIELVRFERGRRTNEEIRFLREGIKILNDFQINMFEIENISTIQSSALLTVDYIKKVLKYESAIT